MKTSTRLNRLSVLTLSAALVAPGLAAADNRPPPPQQQHSQRHDDRSDRRGRPEYNADQSGFARDYYRHHQWDGRPLPHGERIVVGRKLPRGAYKRPLPPDLAYRFRHRDGYRSYIVGDDIVLIAIATGIVVDVLVNVHR